MARDIDDLGSGVGSAFAEIRFKPGDALEDLIKELESLPKGSKVMHIHGADRIVPLGPFTLAIDMGDPGGVVS